MNPRAIGNTGVQTKQHDLVIVGGLAALLWLAGCQDEEIRRYQVPKPETLQKDVPTTDKLQRLLGLIVPHGDRVWFFKLVGPQQLIAEQEEKFDGFIQTIRFQESRAEPITWKVPDGWQQEAGAGMRYATLHLGPKDQPLEMTVTALPREREAASVLENVNRWRGQLGLKPIPETELGRVSKEVKVGDTSATRVDMTGPGGGRTGMSPPFAPGRGP